MRQHGWKRKTVKASMTTEDVQLNSVFGKYSDTEMISKLKELASNPCKPQFARDNIQPLWNQILCLRKLMVLQDSQIIWRKRKLEQFVKDKLRGSSRFVVTDQQNTTKMSRNQSSHSSSLSCLLNSIDSTKGHDDSRRSSSLLTFDDSFLEKLISTEDSFRVNSDTPNKSISPIVYSDQSMDGSMLRSLNEAPSGKINHTNDYLKSPALDGPHIRHIQSPHRSIRLLNFIDDHLQRNVVPVGPQFQVEVPEWSGPVKRSILIVQYKHYSNNSKWLGTRVWPLEIGHVKVSGRTIGKGRPNSCCCVSPGSVDCIGRHIVEERLVLQGDLGPAFFSWKFDDMGNQVLKLWTLKEQQIFESLVKRKNFLKRALKCFPNKSRKEIANYYFDVYIPQLMSLQKRSSSRKIVDTDGEDEAKGFNYMGFKERPMGRLISSTIRKK
ncbi:hypothetical protein ACJIZ3_024021 [Penstemon smallii]|uniref:Uncharacterized protein n=1 Tax=Penstemon smallii TaxID=265156 RepID=A0ABD3TRS4_9LAMI